jgi:hypothetical protein
MSIFTITGAYKYSSTAAKYTPVQLYGIFEIAGLLFSGFWQAECLLGSPRSRISR